MKVCAQPGCPELTEQTRCAAHTRAQRATQDANRPGTTARGYGHRHQRKRDQWKRTVDEGRCVCPTCRLPILPGHPWDLGHTHDRAGYLGPQHEWCNRATKRIVPPPSFPPPPQA